VPPGYRLYAEQSLGAAVLTNEADQVALSYRVRFADEALAAQLAQQLNASSIVDLQVAQHGDELEILAAEDLALLTDWQTDPNACPLPSSLRSE
jgi:hypothetical protein